MRIGIPITCLCSLVPNLCLSHKEHTMCATLTGVRVQNWTKNRVGSVKYCHFIKAGMKENINLTLWNHRSDKTVVNFNRDANSVHVALTLTFKWSD